VMTEVFWWWGAGLVLLLAVVPWVMDRVNAFAVRGVATERGRVSVIIPARNEVAGIAECVRSFLEDAAVSEVVVVDDGSTDGTGAAAMAVADERVRVVLAGALPEGWAGKMWACSVGRPRGRFLFLRMRTCDWCRGLGFRSVRTCWSADGWGC